MLVIGAILVAGASCDATDPRSRTDSPPGSERGLMFTSSFDSEIGDWRVERCCDHSVRRVRNPVRAGSRALRFEIRKGEPFVANANRAELRRPGDYRVTGGIGDERWFGFSTFIPPDWESDVEGDVIAQWHASPDFDCETWRSPPLQITTEGEEVRVLMRWDSKPCTDHDEAEGSETIHAGDLARGRWTDWVVHATWDYDDDGMLRMWRDGKLVVDRRGPNAYNDQRGLFFKIGVYKWRWKEPDERSRVTRRVVFHDEVRIGGPDASCEDVKPPGAPGCEEPPRHSDQAKTSTRSSAASSER
jgi:hypothetical protein